MKAASPSLASAFGEGPKLLGKLFSQKNVLDSPVIYLFLPVGAIALSMRCGLAKSLTLLFMPLIYCMGIAYSHPMPDPDAFFWQRYLTPVLPLLIIPSAGGRERGFTQARRARGGRHESPSANQNQGGLLQGGSLLLAGGDPHCAGASTRTCRRRAASCSLLL
jgi:hypothetical protein